MTIEQAAEFLAEYGNVSSDPKRLLKEKPTPQQLKEAVEYAKDLVDFAATLIRRHHGL
jgi:hypothetical protein